MIGQVYVWYLIVAVAAAVAAVAVVAVVAVVAAVAENGLGRLSVPVQRDYTGFLPGPEHTATHPVLTETDPNYRGDLESNCEDHLKVPHENLKYNYSY